MGAFVDMVGLDKEIWGTKYIYMGYNDNKNNFIRQDYEIYGNDENKNVNYS